MKEPTRWSKDDGAPRPGLELVLRAARRPRPPGADELARLGAMVDQLPRRSAAPAHRWSRFAVAAGVAVVIAALGTGVWALRGRRAPAVLAAAERLRPSLPPVAAPAPEPREESGADAVAEAKAPVRRRNVISSARLSMARHERASQPALGEAGPDNLAREIALIDAARSDVGAAPSRALVALERHRREFPRGQLAAEREFLAVEALGRMNRTDEARRRAAALAVSYPSSSYAARASRLLQPSP